MHLKEEFLHFVWKYKRFDHALLKTTDGQEIIIEKHGVHNLASGPDFHNATITIGDTKWAGNVEMHIKASDWKAHQHQHDAAYDNVILHVVWESDMEVTNTKNQRIPCLRMDDKVRPQDIENYLSLKQNQNWIPCESQISDMDSIIHEQAINRALISRMQRKSQSIIDMLKFYNNDWNKVFYTALAGAYGAKINKSAFEHLARITPWEILAKHADHIFQLEALLIGQAGFLTETPQCDYQSELKKEHQFLSKKYQLKPMDVCAWKLSGLRPISFPLIRLAQFAKLWHLYQGLFSRVLNESDLSTVKKHFEYEIDGFWNTHYNFSKPTQPAVKKVGESLRNNILINAVVPTLFAYADLRKDQELKDRMTTFLELSKPESNSIVRQWKSLGIQATSAFSTQGLLELKNEFCTFKKCLQCPVGVRILKTNTE